MQPLPSLQGQREGRRGGRRGGGRRGGRRGGGRRGGRRGGGGGQRSLNPNIFSCGLSLPIIGASLSEPHTSVTAFAEVVCMSVCGHIL